MKIFLKALLIVILFTGPVFAETFMSALKRAYETNPELNAERENLNISEQELNISKGSYLPTVTLSGSKSQENTNKFSIESRMLMRIFLLVRHQIKRPKVPLGGCAATVGGKASECS